LSNVYIALGARPPEHLAQPIATGQRLGRFTDQTSYIHPTIDGINTGYFDWIGAAHFVADRRNAAMHGKKFLLDSAYAGIDDSNLYVRLDFTDDAFLQQSNDDVLAGDFDISIRIDSVGANSADGKRKRENQLELSVVDGKLVKWELSPGAKGGSGGAEVCLEKILEARIPLGEIQAQIGDALEIRASIWQQGLPVDSLPAEGAITLRVLRENEFEAIASEEHWRA